MPDIIETTLTLYRGRDFVRDWQLVDDDGVSLIDEGMLLALVIADSPAADATVRLTLGQQVDTSVSGFSGRDNDTGTITVCIRASDIDAIPGDHSEPLRMFHSFGEIDGEALTRALRIGPCDILPKV